jgi:hypothetical protein
MNIHQLACQPLFDITSNVSATVITAGHDSQVSAERTIRLLGETALIREGLTGI